jgi:hypothetical protein
MLVVILVIGAGLLGPNEGRLTGLAEGGDQGEYDTILRRVKLGTGFLSFLIIAATFMMVARVPESNEAGSVDEAALVGAKIFVGSGCGSCHTLAAAHTDGNRRTEPRRRGGGSERGRRSRRDRRSLAELFSADALYAWGPFEELRGRNAIRGRWAAATADR